MTLRRVIISQRCDFTGPPHGEWRDALDVRLARFVLAAGALPLPVPSALSEPILAEWLNAMAPDAVLLSGGSDIGTTPDRDALETALMDHARRHALPLLGICRGMQVLARAAGGALMRVEGHVATRHRLFGELDHDVNSYHTLALDGLPSDYRALAKAPDGSVEAISHRTLPWEGWMWHPERADRFDPSDVARFGKVISR
ncbi:Gamma-glutamyl-gamma-aminobutyrate hydrolase PuuD [Jannaschia donghaensis]|uniref:Gamma-glutamyl-gamma-aminobutyrate hydrolase PuuD n=1 Tax=Jannaschia donghaensis TaxID=420998 RepID=A0A0M6YEW7_9RHOB|nr:Gamma-glutamyl-gamma-aminobutyrate hydrolase PuuD [Jannaschia donghaensis]